MGSFFADSSNITILGGSFNDVKGNLTVLDHSRHTTNLSSNNKYTNNVVNAHNDNSTRINYRGSDEDLPSLPHTSRSAEDHTGPPPSQRPRFSPPQIPSTGGTVTNLDSFNVENTHINGVFNNNSQNYYQGGAPPLDNRGQHNGPKLMPGPGPGAFPSTSRPYGSGQFNTPVQVPFAAFPQQMGVGRPPGPHMSVSGANMQQMDEDMGRNFEKWLMSTISHAQSMAAGNSGRNYDPQAAYSSPSPNVEGSDSMNTRMANLSVNDLPLQIPTRVSPPTSFSSDPQFGLKRTDQMSSSNPSSSNLSPYNKVVQQGSRSNPTPPVAPHMNERDTASFLSLPAETPPYGNNPNKPPPGPPPASTSPFNFPPSSSGGPNFNIYYGDLTKQDHGVHHTNIDSFNEHNNTLQDSFNDNSFVGPPGKRSAIKSNQKRRLPGSEVPIETRKKRNSEVRTPPDPNQESSSDETDSDEQIPTEESTVDSSEKKKTAKKWPLFGRK